MSKLCLAVFGFAACLCLFSLGTGCSFVHGGWGGQAANLLDSREEQIAATGLQSIRVDAGAGLLEIKGVPGATDVRLVAEFRGKDQDDLQQLTLKHERAGDALVVTSLTEDGRGRIDLWLEVPAGLNLSVEDGSGSLTIANISGAIDVRDGSGSLRVSDAGAGLSIQDGSGSVDVHGVQGNVDLKDGSGSIDIQGVQGDVDIVDGSGSLSVADVGGTVRVKDGSGSIDVRNVKGRFELLNDGSGSVHTADILGGEAT
jgi:hypothetical protein